MLFDPDNPRNTLLQIEVIFNIGSTIYLYYFTQIKYFSFDFILKKLLIKDHDKIPITSF